MRLDINYRKKSVKTTNTWRLNNTLLNNQEITEEIKIAQKQMTMKTQQLKPMGCSKSSSKREVYSNTILPQETSQINNLTLQLKQLEKEEQKNPQS